jgi:hypothetical protein
MIAWLGNINSCGGHATEAALGSNWVQAGREIEAQEVALIREVVELFPGLSRKELARTLCDHLGWYTATGTYKEDACTKLLGRLEAQGLVGLPEKRPAGSRRAVAAAPVWGARTDPGQAVTGCLRQVGPVRLEVVADEPTLGLWKEYVGRYHYLGDPRPFGCYLRYFVVTERGPVGCVLLAGAAKAIAVRDRWIGWTRGQRLRHLGWVVNNTRFVVFPWVEVRNLASHVLGQVARRMGQDWQARWGYRPVLLETFVDPAKYPGTCYRASGWQCVGQTKGEGLPRRGKTYRTTAKLVYVRPLVEEFREVLCADALGARPVGA